MADVWDWVGEAMQGFIDRRDRPRYEMGRLFYAGMENVRQDPEKAVALFEAAKVASMHLEEKWWTILCDHWRCQVLLEKTRDIAAAAKLANELIAEATGDKASAGLPQLICLHDDRAGAMLSMDPLGYADEIAADCTVIETKGAELTSCQHCSRATRIGVSLCKNDLDAVEPAALQGIKQCAADRASHYLPIYYCALCMVAVRRKDWTGLAHWARSGELFYGKMGSESSNIELLMWNAVAILKQSGGELARHAYKKARNAGKSAGYKLTHNFYDALATFHEEDGNPKLALASLKMQLDNTSGAPYLEANTRLERIRLLKASGLPFDDDLVQLNSAAGLLRDPSQITDRLNSILNGS